MNALRAGLSKIVHTLMSICSAILSTLKSVFGTTEYPSNNESEEKPHQMKELLEEMLRHYGLTEVLGPKSDPTILAMLMEMGYDENADDSNIAWCSAALNYFCKKLGYERSGSLAARSWLKMPVVVLQPELGDVVVFWRESPSSWKGHVAVYINHDMKYVYCLGGNQANSLIISAYSRDRVLGYRKLRKLTDIT